MADTIIDAGPVDYLIVFLYFGVVLGIGLLARRQVSDSLDFFLSGRSLPALMRDVLPNGLLGIAIAGLLAAFMAGMAANVSAFNTVLS